MKKLLFFNILILIVFVAQVDAQSRSKAFFEKGSAKSVFLPTSKITKQQKLEYFRDTEDKTIAKDAKTEANDKLAQEKTNDLQNNNLEQDEELTPSQKIIAKYGKPEEDLTYYPENNAPAPFKGIMAALQIGDEELAFKYAKQYINYTAKEADLVGKTIAFQKLALEGLGRAEQGRFSNDTDVAEYKYLLEKELKEKQEREERERNLAKTVTLSKKDSSLFNSFNDAYKQQIEKTNSRAISYYDGLEAKKKEKIAKGEIQEEEETVEQKGEKLIKRASIRNQYQGRVPVDPKGEVSIHFFFKPNEKSSMELGVHVEELYRSIIKEQNVKLAGVNVDGLSLAAFNRVVKPHFPILVGSKFAKVMGITTFPSIYFRCNNTGEVFVFNKPAQKYELGEILSLMRGEK